MNKLLVAILGTLAALAVMTVFIVQKKPISKPATIPTASPSTLVLQKYNDPSGFAFQYPSSLIASSKESTSQKIYSAVEITDASSSGKINLSVESSSLKNVDDWFKNDKKMATFSGKIKSLKLSDLDARQFSLGNTQTTLAVDQGALITIKTVDNTQTNIWLPIHEIVVSSFTFTAPPDSSPAAGGSDSSGTDDVVYEGEETVE